MMISGYPSFRGDNQYEVMQNVLKQAVSFKESIWTKVSAKCKSFILMMLKKYPDERLSAQQAFYYPWIKKAIQKTVQSNKQEHVIAIIRDFSFQNKLQAVVYTYIVQQILTCDQKRFLFQTFQQLDKKNYGVIESTQFFQPLQLIKDISEEKVKFLMKIIDNNCSGRINFTEFLVAGIDPRKSLNENYFQQAFQYFDFDYSGAITFEEIIHFLEDTKESQEQIKKILQQVDQNHDGNISKEDFVIFLMHKTKKKLCAVSLGKIEDEYEKDKYKKNNKENSKLKNMKQKQSFMQQLGRQQNKAKTASIKDEKQNKALVQKRGIKKGRQYQLNKRIESKTRIISRKRQVIKPQERIISRQIIILEKIGFHQTTVKQTHKKVMIAT